MEEGVGGAVLHGGLSQFVLQLALDWQLRHCPEHHSADDLHLLIVEPVSFDELLLKEELPPQHLMLQVQTLNYRQRILPLAVRHVDLREEYLPRQIVHVNVLRWVVALWIVLLQLQLPLILHNTRLNIIKVVQPRHQPQSPKCIILEEHLARVE